MKNAKLVKIILGAALASGTAFAAADSAGQKQAPGAGQDANVTKGQGKCGAGKCGAGKCGASQKK